MKLFNLFRIMIYILANLLGNLMSHTHKNYWLEIKIR
jgi:hypothetical protein